ncbi:anthranilate synthase component I family protein [Nocardioides sp. MJB4]|uniref:Anthranilate synthase component I family protein n=2 Tax=Nocardioides donggukensis TaxID=2774019 RepID=A0A927K1V6_9ACTN|nr:anthranilate synthase component I family protein [Nocardioides donggukensis]
MAATHDRCFWLDGGGARAWSGRRSLLGWLDDDDVSLTYDAATGEVIRHCGGASEVVGDDVFAVLEREIARDGGGPGGSSRSGGGGGQWVGYFGYASRPDLPALSDPPVRPGDPAGLPTAVWMRARQVDVIDHPAPPPAVGAAPSPRADDEPDPPAVYLDAFARVQEHLRAGNTYEVNLTHRITVPSELDPVAAYLRLRELNPAPYAGFLQHRGSWLLSSSPERYATVDRHRRIETKPIKGTTPRGATPAEDERLRRLLGTDPKLRAENLMITDLLRNDLGMVCRPGTVTVPGLMEVESYPSVHQLVSTVRGRLRDDVTTVGALRALFPAGSMTGAPKLRTMEVIEEVEATPRGVYAGAFGWIAEDGRADLGVVIRSLTTAGDGHWTLGTGGGITVRSEPAEEYAESRWKADRLLRVLAGE